MQPRKNIYVGGRYIYFLKLVCYLVEDALLFADVTGVVVLHQVVVQLRRIVVPGLAKLAPRVPRLSQRGVTLSIWHTVENATKHDSSLCIKKTENLSLCTPHSSHALRRGTRPRLQREKKEAISAQEKMLS